MGFTYKPSTPHKCSTWIIQDGQHNVLRSQDRVIQPVFNSPRPIQVHLLPNCEKSSCSTRLLCLMPTSTDLFSSKAWQAHRQNSLCLFARLSISLQPKANKHHNVACPTSQMHQLGVPTQRGFEWNNSPNSALYTVITPELWDIQSVS